MEEEQLVMEVLPSDGGITGKTGSEGWSRIEILYLVHVSRTFKKFSIFLQI